MPLEGAAPVTGGPSVALLAWAHAAGGEGEVGAVEVRVGSSQVVLAQGDITRMETDAIVNAANQTLLGGGGVDGAIHRAGGPQILEECRRLGGCPTGEARITSGGRLKARHVIHAVGPVYGDGRRGEAALLAGAYRNSLELAAAHGLRSVSFPAISTGAYGYPMAEAARVALTTVLDFLRDHPQVELVRFVLFGEAAYGSFAEVLGDLAPGAADA